MIDQVFLPWRGEFGQMIMTHVRWVNYLLTSNPDGKSIVCCRPGDEALFPLATHYFYDWDEPADKRKNTDMLQSYQNKVYLESLTEQITEHYGYDTIGAKTSFLIPINGQKPQRFKAHKDWSFKPVPQQPRGRHLIPDIVVGPRYREHGGHRNYPHWQVIVDLLESAGYVVGLVGMESTSVDCRIRYPEMKSWLYDSLDTTLEWMNRAKLTVTSDCGIAHLAVLNQTPLAVMYEEKGREAGHPTWPWVWPKMHQMAFTAVHPILMAYSNPDGAWQQIKQVLG